MTIIIAHTATPHPGSFWPLIQISPGFMNTMKGNIFPSTNHANLKTDFILHIHMPLDICRVFQNAFPFLANVGSSHVPRMRKKASGSDNSFAKEGLNNQPPPPKKKQATGQSSPLTASPRPLKSAGSRKGLTLGRLIISRNS